MESHSGSVPALVHSRLRDSSALALYLSTRKTRMGRALLGSFGAMYRRHTSGEPVYLSGKP